MLAAGGVCWVGLGQEVWPLRHKPTGAQTRMPTCDFQPVVWDRMLEDDLQHLVRLAVREDLGRQMDWTTVALIPSDRQGAACLVARQSGVSAGLPVVPAVLRETHADVVWHPRIEDGQPFSAGTVLGELAGSVRDLLTLERTILNFLSRLCGIATLTRRYVDAVSGTGVRIYDTRKTTPGWRRLEKYAVLCGGGHNHRCGLFDAFLVKDNHLAFTGSRNDPASALRALRDFVHQTKLHYPQLEHLPVEVEVDSLAQLENVLAEKPTLVLLDNFTIEDLKRAVAMRDRIAAETLLEASGGIRLENVRQVADTGVDRISIGALTHQAVAVDLALDWMERANQAPTMRP
ncbi:MAG: nicotinate-nucleotide diphosphorylase (carboxylating) [Pirellulaceae bacterium]|nr:MAG: nicotinate-nucleotide diphosphorylase (carboxylating) [Pirellulaceae bacterium]